MKALILNSGVGRRMGALTSEHPKCMTELLDNETILSRQLKQLAQEGIREVVITTGLFDTVLKDYCEDVAADLSCTFVHNPDYDKTNYIYSIYRAREVLDDDILLMHGDLVFADSVLDDVLRQSGSCMTVSSTLPLPEKDFKAVVENGKIVKVGIEFFENAVTAQPLYRLVHSDWKTWLNHIINFCEAGKTGCYAENALNEVSDRCAILPLDVKNRLCGEIDNPEDLEMMRRRLMEEKQ